MRLYRLTLRLHRLTARLHRLRLHVLPLRLRVLPPRLHLLRADLLRLSRLAAGLRLPVSPLGLLLMLFRLRLLARTRMVGLRRLRVVVTGVMPLLILRAHRHRDRRCKRQG
ncbi:MAG TPA: hypothetical protein VGI12_14665 [Vicinamibacterales bacterium]